MHSHIKCVAEFDDLKKFLSILEFFILMFQNSMYCQPMYMFQNQETIVLGSWSLKKRKSVLSDLANKNIGGPV